MTDRCTRISALRLRSGFHFNRKEADWDAGRAWIELNLQNLAHNAAVLQQAMPPGCRMMAVVKANAYGHGAAEISACLERAGVEAFAVATLEEGIQLRQHGIRGDILILGYTDVRRAPELRRFGLIQTLIDANYAEALNRQGVPVRAHLKIDTGMHRLGIPAGEEAAVKRIFSLERIAVEGMYSHLGCSDSLLPEDVAFTREQIRRFYRLVDSLKRDGLPAPKLHLQSSYGLLNYPELRCDYARVGIALYGALSTPRTETVRRLDLRPVLSLRARVALIRTVPKGESVGYGRCFTAERESRIALLPVGYGDGYPRSLSCGAGRVRIRGYDVPVAGRVCMDQLMVDITDAPEVAVGDEAILIGTEESLTAPEVACCAGSISNELLCRMGSRLPVRIAGRPERDNRKKRCSGKR